MLFHSPQFIFVFLPIALLGYYLLGSSKAASLAILWLGATSLFFYGYWNVSYVYLILGSIVFNYAGGAWIAHVFKNGLLERAYRIRNVCIAVNLVLLFYYKYLMFGVTQIDKIFNSNIDIPNIILPIGISFFTFTQIAYLVDCSRGAAEERKFTNYLLFVTYFPHLVAGPILHHDEMMPQFRSVTAKINFENLAKGVTFFALGLFKKIVIADSLSVYVGPVFDTHWTVMAPADAWIAAIAYSLQLYYDFSGYSDMAIGLSMMFNVKLPVNFNSPYKSQSIIEFWRRWHMTLSRFLRDYLYIGLGGNRKGPARRYLNLAATMLLGGLWHGANWTFLVWGGMHGLFLAVNHLWRASPAAKRIPMHPALCLGITFLSVAIAWVFFRAPDVDVAMRILRSMSELVLNPRPELVNWQQTAWIGLPLAWAFFAPNTNELMNYKFGTSAMPDGHHKHLRWRPSPTWSVVVGIALFATAAIGVASHHSLAFLYFQF